MVVILFSIKDAICAAKILNINFDKFSLKEFWEGINIELEHGKTNCQTNITNNDLIMTAKIALTHLNEFPNYYNHDYGIKVYENFLKVK